MLHGKTLTSTFLFVSTLSLTLLLVGFASGDVHCENNSDVPLTDEQRLYRKLRSNYDPSTRPVYNASHPVTVKIGITLTQIFDLDEKNQVLTTNVWLDHEWVDEKMRWNPEEYNGLHVLRIPCAHLWKPDIILYNSVEDYTGGYMQALAMVSSDGTVFWPPIVKFHSTCAIDITFFPFDDQVCKMKLGSWAYDGFQVDVVNRSSGVDLSNYVTNGEWELLRVDAVRNVVTYPCCPEPFPDVTFTIYLRRRTLYYTYNVIIPCVMLSTLTLLVFWMSPESGEKVTLGLTVLLAFSVFMLLIAENMPATSSYVPLIGIYLTSVMALTSLSVILAVVVSNISNRGKKEKVMPRAFRSVVIGLARAMCFQLHYVRPDVTSGRCLGPGGSSRSRAGVLYKGVHNHLSSDSGCGLIDCETSFDLSGGNMAASTSYSPASGTPMQVSAAALRAEFGRARRGLSLERMLASWTRCCYVFATSSCARRKKTGRKPVPGVAGSGGSSGSIPLLAFCVGHAGGLLTSLVVLPLTKKSVL
ncbi:neuronal acetylcholine receptor subunit alpha-10-like [Pomacea canaliculata]|uniref:neuronal acetylcholine receptor subunit alpha-10-like n=1 Tax=Pomacea canaliculata TaxID=400727 RepID=UPI000D731D69|nr:neuronal acetylcholine receptor subunit alpha-10-like [Pomacea canaliculata]